MNAPGDRPDSKTVQTALLKFDQIHRWDNVIVAVQEILTFC